LLENLSKGIKIITFKTCCIAPEVKLPTPPFIAQSKKRKIFTSHKVFLCVCMGKEGKDIKERKKERKKILQISLNSLRKCYIVSHHPISHICPHSGSEHFLCCFSARLCCQEDM
jgi:hypothetical protein